MAKIRTKKFILQAIALYRDNRPINKPIDIWNPYFKISLAFTDEELQAMSKQELNNLVKVAVICLNGESYIKWLDARIKAIKEKGVK